MKKVKIFKTEIEYDDENFIILDAYKVKLKKEMLLIIRLFEQTTGFECFKDLDTMVKKWTAYGRLYSLGLFKNRTKNCNLEAEDSFFKKLIYEILGV